MWIAIFSVTYLIGARAVIGLLRTLVHVDIPRRVPRSTPEDRAMTQGGHIPGEAGLWVVLLGRSGPLTNAVDLVEVGNGDLSVRPPRKGANITTPRPQAAGSQRPHPGMAFTADLSRTTALRSLRSA